jgi:hypothetical protein
MTLSNIDLDTTASSQTIDQPNRRTIYDASFTEIFWKSFTAGFALGLGRMATSVLFFVIVGALFVQYAQPLIDDMLSPIEQLLQSHQNMNSSIPTLFPSNVQQQDILNLFQPQKN